MAKVLVTGGKGFLGQHLVSRLCAQNEQVRILDHSQRNGHQDAPVECICGDIRDMESVEKAVSGVEVVIHLVSNFRKGGSDKQEAFAVNVQGTANVLQACQKYRVKQLIHCSTIGVHGDVLEIPANEETPFNPGDLYQETKLLAEQKVWEWHRRNGLPTTVIRPISVLGPGDDRMLKLFRMIKKRLFVTVGNGEVLFQPAYIDDVIDGFLLSLRNQAALGHVFIIGGEEYVTLKELIRVVADELEVPRPRLRIPLRPVIALANLCERVCVPLHLEPPLHRRRVSFFENNRAFTIAKAKRVLGYEPKFSLREGIRRTISWYRQHGWL